MRRAVSGVAMFEMLVVVLIMEIVVLFVVSK